MNQEEPIWLPIHDHEGYDVSSHGEVRNANSGRIMKVSVNQFGVQFLSLRNSKKKQYVTVSLAHLVASTFVAGQNKNDNTVLYLDGDQTNNHASNLLWAQRWHAMAYHREISVVRDANRRPIVDDLHRTYNSITEAAMATGALPSAIDYAVSYNDAMKTGPEDSLYSRSVGNFSHKVWPSGRIFHSVS